MIISASRRTDIPAYFSEWWMNRVEEGYVCVRNPFRYHQVSRVSLSPDVVDCIVFWSKNPKPFIPYLGKLNSYMYYFQRNPFRYHQVSRVSLSPDVVDCIVFWSKNPKPFIPYLGKLNSYMYYFQYTLNAYGNIPYLGKLNSYMYYFQYTLNAYGNEIETYLPSFYSRMETFRQLAKQIGKERVIWRYDPILISEKYTVDWHMEQFQMIAEGLEDCTQLCVISFLDEYPRIKKGLERLNIRGVAENEKYMIARGFSEITKERGMELATCCEEIDLSSYGIGHSSCIDGKLISKLLGYQIKGRKDKGQRKGCGCMESIDIGSYHTCRIGHSSCIDGKLISKLLGYQIKGRKDKGQRKGCGCMESIDIGSYHTCPNGCVYCYAGGQNKKNGKKIADWNGNSPVLGSVLTEEDFVTDKGR